MEPTPATSPIDAPLQLLLAQDGWWTRLWFRQSSSTFAPDTDALFYYIFWVSAFFFVLLMALMVYWGFKYKRRAGVPAEVSPAHNTPLEITWSVVPTILMLVMFVWGAQGYLKKVVAPSDAEIINVNVKRWAWSFTYDHGGGSLQTERIADVDTPVYALPVDRPVKFIMSSSDVIHSFYIAGFRIKRDVFPNRYTTVWAHPTAITHRWDPDAKTAVPLGSDTMMLTLQCTEYCGDQHSQMANRIAVMSEPDYQAWKAAQLDTSTIPLVELGETLSKTKGCMACHQVGDADGSGPSWKNIWGEARPAAGGKSAIEPTVGFNYIRQSILEPGAYVKAGWPNNMPQYQGQLNERELLALAMYIKSLTESAREEALEQSDTELNEREAPETPPDPSAYFEGASG